MKQQILNNDMQHFLEQWDAQHLTHRIWARDPRVWNYPPLKKGDQGGFNSSNNPSNWLGWLDAPEQFLENPPLLAEFVDEIRGDGFTDAVVLGMGGSSLSCMVFAENFPVREGFLRLHVLDSIHPSHINSLESELDLKRTLFIVASKSGTTLEVELLRKYFSSKVSPCHLIAITDPGTSLERLAIEQGYRRIFYGEPDIGGRYSVFSNFGMLPAALMGVDVSRVLSQANDMMHRCAPSIHAHDNPGVRLGVMLGLQMLNGNNVCGLNPSTFGKSFALWQQQLLAESLGKQGKGSFFYIDGSAPILVNASHGIGGELYRWQFATAVAASVIGVNAFDQPDVEATKKATKTLLSPNLPLSPPGRGIKGEGQNLLAKIVTLASSKSFISILAFVGENPQTTTVLELLRSSIATATSKIVSLEFGPRYLHSTGQFHKGGCNRGLYLVLINNDDDDDSVVPDTNLTLSSVLRAQALADVMTMEQLGRAVLTIDLEGDTLASIMSLQKIIDAQHVIENQVDMYAM